jgi:hypothetical protein
LRKKGRADAISYVISLSYGHISCPLSVSEAVRPPFPLPRTISKTRRLLCSHILLARSEGRRSLSQTLVTVPSAQPCQRAVSLAVQLANEQGETRSEDQAALFTAVGRYLEGEPKVSSFANSKGAINSGLPKRAAAEYRRAVDAANRTRISQVLSIFRAVGRALTRSVCNEDEDNWSEKRRREKVVVSVYTVSAP